MSFLQDYSTAIAIFGVVLVGILVAGFVKLQEKRLLAAAGGVVLLLVGLFFLTRGGDEERNKVKAVLYAIADCVERNELEEGLQYLHSDRKDLRASVKATIGRFTFEQVKIKPNLTIEVDMETTPPTAKATFNVVVVGDFSNVYMGKSVPRYMEVFFRKEESGWRVFSYKDYPPQRGLKKKSKG